ncbi:MAG: hypothetical protein LUF82_03120 [Clostridia bacterium]|nr:hypothetical protein [Clostridia bacterium]
MADNKKYKVTTYFTGDKNIENILTNIAIAKAYGSSAEDKEKNSEKSYQTIEKREAI